MAFAGSKSCRRSDAKSREMSPAVGTFTNAGSAT